MAILKEYLGDSVYAAWDGYHVVLTTENGMGPSNTIYLDDGVVKRLTNYVKLIHERQREEAHDETTEPC